MKLYTEQQTHQDKVGKSNVKQKELPVESLDFLSENNISLEIKNVYTNYGSTNDRNRFRTYIKPLKNETTLVLMMVLLATMLIIIPGFVDYLMHMSRYRGIQELQKVALITNQLSTSVILLQSLFQYRLNLIFNKKSISSEVSELIDFNTENYNRRKTL